MRPIAWPWLVISSVVALAVAGAAEMRPHYGGSLRIALRAAPASLDPARLADSEAACVSPLVFEGLTRFDAAARLQPRLATRWQSDPGSGHWQFWLRPGVTLHDGTLLTAAAVAASLHTANPAWTVNTDGDSVVIDTPAPAPQLPAELALPRNGIVRYAGDKLLGTGPFRISDWQPGRRLLLAAYDDYWGGRPFLDSIVVTLGQNWRQQMIALELGNAELAEVAPQQARRASLAGHTVTQSAPDQLLALVFTRGAQSDADAQLRRALSAAVDRPSIVGVLLQAQGEAAESILPNWMTGYAMLFTRPATAAAPASAATMTLSYDPSDPANQLIAERVALNARDAGIRIQTAASASNPDVRLLRIPLESPQPQLALQAVAASAGLPAPQFQGTSPQELYAREMEMMQAARIIPLAHVPQVYVIAPNVNGWRSRRLGALPLGDVWLAGGAP